MRDRPLGPNVGMCTAVVFVVHVAEEVLDRPRHNSQLRFGILRKSYCDRADQRYRSNARRARRDTLVLAQIKRSLNPPRPSWPASLRVLRGFAVGFDAYMAFVHARL